MTFKKFIHYDTEIERAILGACLLEKLAFGRIYGRISAQTFYRTSHQKVFQVMQDMYDNSVPIDILTVANRLAANGDPVLDGMDVGPFLDVLTMHVVSSLHIEYHAHLVHEMWQRREVLRLKSQPADQLDPRKDLNDINKRISEILGNEAKRDWYSMDELMFDLMKHQSDMAAGKKDFITTGFKKVDHTNGGYFGGQLIVIGSRPSVGKSALMGQKALSQARSGKKVGIISLEMNNTEIAARLSSIDTDIPFQRIYRDIANDEALHRSFYNQISRSTINLPIYVSDKTKVNVNEIRAKATKLKATRGLDVLMVDYLQLVDTTGDNKQYNREQEVAKMSRGLKLLAMELEIPVIVLCQLNRQSTHRTKGDRYPRLSDLRESGAIEQDADIVMFLHRDWMAGIEVDENGSTTEFSADLLVPKWRNGAANFRVQLDFEPEKMKFKEQGQVNTWRPIVEDEGEKSF